MKHRWRRSGLISGLRTCPRCGAEAIVDPYNFEWVKPNTFEAVPDKCPGASTSSTEGGANA